MATVSVVTKDEWDTVIRRLDNHIADLDAKIVSLQQKLPSLLALQRSYDKRLKSKI